jgi:hypothetical protein
MGYRLGDSVAIAGVNGTWSIERMQQDARGVFPTKYTLNDGDRLADAERDRISHTGSLLEIGRDGCVRVIEQ